MNHPAGGNNRLLRDIRSQIELALQSFVGEPNNEINRQAITNKVHQLLKPHFNNPTQAQITFGTNYIYKIQLPTDPLTFYSEQSYIGVMEGELVRVGIGYAEHLSELLNDKYADNPTRIFTSDFGRTVEERSLVPLDDFLMTSIIFGTVYLFKDNAWYIRDNNNFETTNMIKLASYLTFR